MRFGKLRGIWTPDYWRRSFRSGRFLRIVRRHGKQERAASAKDVEFLNAPEIHGDDDYRSGDIVLTVSGDSKPVVKVAECQVGPEDQDFNHRLRKPSGDRGLVLPDFRGRFEVEQIGNDRRV